jgi:hypothetical protein
MNVKIWTVAADDESGTRATVHLTEKSAYLQWLEWQFRGELDEDEKMDMKDAAAFIESEDYAGMWVWKGDRAFGEPLDTYEIEEHEIEVPASWKSSGFR